MSYPLAPCDTNKMLLQGAKGLKTQKKVKGALTTPKLPLGAPIDLPDPATQKKLDLQMNPISPSLIGGLGNTQLPGSYNTMMA